MSSTTSRVGKRGTIVVPAALRDRYGLEEGVLVIAEEREDGILLRPAVAVPVEIYTPERRAEFLLNNAVDADNDNGRQLRKTTTTTSTSCCWTTRRWGIARCSC